MPAIRQETTLHRFLIIHTTLTVGFLVYFHLFTFIKSSIWALQDIRWAIFDEMKELLYHFSHIDWPPILNAVFLITLFFALIFLINRSKVFPWVFIAAYILWGLRLIHIARFIHHYGFSWAVLSFANIIDLLLFCTGIIIPVLTFIKRRLSRLEKY